MERYAFGVAVIVPLLLLAACGSRERPRRPSFESQFHPPTTMLLAYAAPDGTLTRAQMEAGLHRDFDKADLNHDGCLDDNEVRLVNEARWKEDASTASPLIDFRHDGCVDYDEFAATARSLFDQLDRNGTGKLTAAQLKPGSAKPGTPDQGEGRHRDRGSPPGSGPSNLQ